MNVSMVTRQASTPSRRLLPWVSLAASLAVVFSLFGPVRSLSAQGKSLNDGVYTADQAKRGETLFMSVGRCYACHQRDLQANAQRKSKQLAGADFIDDYRGGTLNDLFYKIRMTMPADGDGGGTLPVNQVADLMAFILQRNGYPAGNQELNPDESQLKMIKFDAPKSGAVRPSSGTGKSSSGGESSAPLD